MISARAQETSAFQFHKGTIKTERLKIRLEVHSVFQFHKGTIKTYKVLWASFPSNQISIP